MKHIKGNIFYPKTYGTKLNPCAICITTNGYVRSDGCCVMGRGIAAQAANLFPELPKILGTKINTAGNNVHCFQFNKATFDYRYIVSFPVKPQKDAFSGSNVVAHMQHRFEIGRIVPGWACKAQLSIIKRSCKQLVQHVDEKGWQIVVLPRVGCGAGELLWNNVRPTLENILDDRFYCVSP